MYRYYGGWLAPNIFYLGKSGVIKVGGLRIAGISGIYDKRHFKLGHFERLPYDDDTARSVYHVREFELMKLHCVGIRIEGPIDIMLSHDWPEGIYNYGDKFSLLRVKPQFKPDMESQTLGSPASMALLKRMKPHPSEEDREFVLRRLREMMKERKEKVGENKNTKEKEEKKEEEIEEETEKEEENKINIFPWPHWTDPPYQCLEEQRKQILKIIGMEDYDVLADTNEGATSSSSIKAPGKQNEKNININKININNTPTAAAIMAKPPEEEISLDIDEL
ncbi:serine/threonine protein phosphatase, putative [Eimeria brunetti]|uniref:Serine/threonine protein phosphatase, putative n=1 Tax=Eimeria brunetti TaxID=51314 RepID=U6LVQ5_9EIME|nr:serine/threonine protein phosphatase, putative [Eimeria brunetti]